jgi:RNA polymerase sigma factor (TIGR02999 family)
MLQSDGITKLLIKWSEGDAEALDQLTTFVYAELRRLAAGYLRGRPSANTLQATALVHEVYIQLLGSQDIEWQSRAHFIAVSARAMRYILIDHARQQSAKKRGGGEMRVPLSRAERLAPRVDVNLLALDEALTEFAARYPRQAKVIELHFFGGLKVDEIPVVMSTDGFDLSRRTVERDLQFARAWLHQEIGRK